MTLFKPSFSTCMSTYWNAHDPLKKGQILLDEFKTLLAFCHANDYDETIQDIATHYMAYVLNEANLHPTTGNEMSWQDMSTKQRDRLVDELLSQWRQAYPNGLDGEYVPFSPLDTERMSIIMDTEIDVHPAKKARFVQHVSESPSTISRAPTMDSQMDDGSAPWDEWFEAKDRIVGDKLQIISANQLGGVITWVVVLDEHGQKKLEIVFPDSDTESESDDES